MEVTVIKKFIVRSNDDGDNNEKDDIVGGMKGKVS